MKFLLLLLVVLVACSAQKEEPELALFMGGLERFSEKLYFSGKVGNWELARFYLHEVEEVLEEVEESGIVEDGIAIPKLAQSMLAPAVRQVEEAVRAKDPTAFLQAYRGMVESCNRCHEASRHGFIKMIEPTRSSFTMQDFR